MPSSPSNPTPAEALESALTWGELVKKAVERPAFDAAGLLVFHTEDVHHQGRPKVPTALGKAPCKAGDFVATPKELAELMGCIIRLIRIGMGR